MEDSGTSGAMGGRGARGSRGEEVARINCVFMSNLEMGALRTEDAFKPIANSLCFRLALPYTLNYFHHGTFLRFRLQDSDW